MERYEHRNQIKLEQLREAIRIGDEQAERGEFSSRTIDEIIADNTAAYPD